MMTKPDFTIIKHGSVWTIRAESADAIAFARAHFAVEEWQGVPENFTTDWRPACELVARLTEEGWVCR
jgi:hypothetical protein